MSKNKKFTAIGQLMNPNPTAYSANNPSQASPEALGDTENETMIKYTEQTTYTPKIANKRATKKDNGFVSWSTYIRPELEKQLKIKALQEEKEIYRLVDEILSDYLKVQHKEF